MVLTNLAHHIDFAFLKEAHRRTRKDGAPGVDGATAEAYERDLEANLRSLHERFKSGSYKAPPVRRAEIPKGDGKTRQLGIPTFEDKVLQRAVTMVLEAVYEQDFLDCSFGYRPRRGAHDALDTLWQATMRMRGGWVLELDVSDCFGTLDHGHLRSFLDQRVRDGVVRRAIDKWLKAGVLEEGLVCRSDSGTPQGGVISPLLANVYLHEVLDVWFAEMVRPVMRGRAELIRYADDAVLVFERESDAHRVLAVLAKRFARFGLTLHPEKTRLVPFLSPSSRARRPRTEVSEPGTFVFLGFTHFWGKSRKGSWIVRRRTSPKSFRKAVKKVDDMLRRQRHQPVWWQQHQLSVMLRGHYSYFGITGNACRLQAFASRVEELWRRWLSRRSHRGRLSFPRFSALLARYPLPPVRVVRSIYGRTANLWV
jgi:group II intron reverse transcriptase/maturase